MKLREYQEKIAEQGLKILREKGLVYLALEVRTGKTPTSLAIAEKYGAKSVLFITKKKTINSIESDFKNFNFKFDLDVINYEKLAENTVKIYDLVIIDEAHSIGAFPKPSNRAKLIRECFSDLPIIFLSGTPCAESYSQIFYQLWVSNRSPFSNYKNFYAWSKDFVSVERKNVGYAIVNDYTKANVSKIRKLIDPYTIYFTQEEAGFKSEVKHNILYSPKTCDYLVKKLKKDNCIVGKSENVIADTGAKLMQKIHQLEGGTIKFESGNTQVLDTSKAEFIKKTFEGKKIAIFYYYIAELRLLTSIFTDYTTDLEEFNTTDKIYIGQQYSNSMGINLSKAEVLVFYNFGFSGTNFIQAIDRLTTIDRLSNDIYFIFHEGSLTEKIYERVKNKQSFTASQFERIKNTI